MGLVVAPKQSKPNKSAIPKTTLAIPTPQWVASESEIKAAVLNSVKEPDLTLFDLILKRDPGFCEEVWLKNRDIVNLTYCLTDHFIAWAHDHGIQPADVRVDFCDLVVENGAPIPSLKFTRRNILSAGGGFVHTFDKTFDHGFDGIMPFQYDLNACRYRAVESNVEFYQALKQMVLAFKNFCQERHYDFATLKFSPVHHALITPDGYVIIPMRIQYFVDDSLPIFERDELAEMLERERKAFNQNPKKVVAI